MSGIVERFKKDSKRAIKCSLPSKLASKLIVPVSLGIPVTETRSEIMLGAGKGGETGEMNEVVKSLKKTFLDLSSLPDSFLKSLFFLLNGYSEDSDCQLQHLSEEAQQMPSEVLTPQEWLGIYQLCCYSGCFHLGYFFRKKALDEIIRIGNMSYDVKFIDSYISACIETEKIDNSAMEKLVSISRKISKNKKKRYRMLTSILGNAGLNRSNIIDESYRRYLANKTIAVCGPGEPQLANGKEIDQFDRVIRINYLYTGKGCDDFYKGQKTSISYFNNEQSEQLKSRYGSKLPPDLDFACFKTKDYANRIKRTNNHIDIRSVVRFDDCFFNGTLNMVPVAVLDALAHGAKKIELYHVDLMLTVKRDMGYYPPSFERDSEKELIRVFNRGSISHDPVTQYNLLYKLWSGGKVVGDKRFDKIMSLGCESYMRELQNTYCVV